METAIEAILKNYADAESSIKTIKDSNKTAGDGFIYYYVAQVNEAAPLEDIAIKQDENTRPS